MSLFILLSLRHPIGNSRTTERIIKLAFTTGGGIQMGSYPHPRNGIVKLDYEFILILKKLGETILDPFAGSGTTSSAAKNLDRNSIGYEVNPEFIPIIKQKLEVHQEDLDGTTYEFLKQDELTNDFEKEIQTLPYIFKDPHTFDKKIDVEKLQFGSKIDKNSPTLREDFFTVKEVISPEKVRLSNDLTVKLIGVKETPIINEQAKKFLTEKTKGKRVFLKYDNVKYDSENNLLCYLYLENKTFINAHLIKNGLVQVDSDIDFKYKEKFQNLFIEANI